MNTIAVRIPTLGVTSSTNLSEYPSHQLHQDTVVHQPVSSSSAIDLSQIDQGSVIHMITLGLNTSTVERCQGLDLRANTIDRPSTQTLLNAHKLEVPNKSDTPNLENEVIFIAQSTNTFNLQSADDRNKSPVQTSIPYDKESTPLKSHISSFHNVPSDAQISATNLKSVQNDPATLKTRRVSFDFTKSSAPLRNILPLQAEVSKPCEKKIIGILKKRNADRAYMTNEMSHNSTTKKILRLNLCTTPKKPNERKTFYHPLKRRRTVLSHDIEDPLYLYSEHCKRQKICSGRFIAPKKSGEPDPDIIFCHPSNRIIDYDSDDPLHLIRDIKNLRISNAFNVRCNVKSDVKKDLKLLKKDNEKPAVIPKSVHVTPKNAPKNPSIIFNMGRQNVPQVTMGNLMNWIRIGSAEQYKPSLSNDIKNEKFNMFNKPTIQNGYSTSNAKADHSNVETENSTQPNTVKSYKRSIFESSDVKKTDLEPENRSSIKQVVDSDREYCKHCLRKGKPLSEAQTCVQSVHEEKRRLIKRIKELKLILKMTPSPPRIPKTFTSRCSLDSFGRCMNKILRKYEPDDPSTYCSHSSGEESDDGYSV